MTGGVNVDVLLGKVAPWPQVGTEVELDQYALRVGGALGNTALALAALGAEAEFFANLGSDALGDWLAGELGASGCALARSPCATALTVGLSHPSGQRTFFTHLGHLERFEVRPLQEAVSRVEAGSLLMVSGYFLLPGLRACAAELMAAARARGVVTLLDTGWPTEGWTPAVKAELQALLAHCDFFLPNLEEVEALTEGSDVTRGLELLDAVCAGRTVIKLGPGGASYRHEGARVTVPAPVVEVEDTVGAGDSFNAGFLAALQQGASWQEATTWAVHTASFAVASRPRRYPSWREVAASVAASAPRASAPS